MAETHGRILVVDDNRMNRIKLSRSLEQQGHTVGVAEGGEQALELLRTQPFDAVLLDIIMPGMDGYEVLERVKGDPALRDIPVIVISALDEVESAVRCIEMGAEDYLPKSFDPVLLRARLNASLQKKKLRDLEKAYLDQELMLRQSEKLATLGRLSAGLAHELNNPAAAAQRGARQLLAAFSRLQRTQLRLAAANLTDSQQGILGALDALARERGTLPPIMDALARSDHEEELEAWLGECGVGTSWEIAPNLVNLGYRRAELEECLAAFTAAQFPAAVEWLNCTTTIYALLEEIGQGTARIATIVQALKAYTYLDQAPIQDVDIHASLDNTLTILRDRFGPGVTLRREYAADLPRVEAYGGELSQVWTHLIGNALDALAGAGELIVRTRRDKDWAVVEVEDSGPGIAEEIRPRIFDPFFTTKPPGQGTGLGLNVCHNIVVQKHRGRLDVHSEPGRTVFRVALPSQLSEAKA
jgi:signal transduction histidine kinase